MYVKANHFDYPAFLQGIQEHGDLQDEELTSEILTGILKDFAKKYKEYNDSNTLTLIQKEICAKFLHAVYYEVERTIVDDVEDGCDDVPEVVVLEQSQIDKCISDSLEDLVALLNCDIDPVDIPSMNLFLSWMSVYIVPGPNDEGYAYHFGSMVFTDAEDFVNHLRTWMEIHLREELSPLDTFILDHIGYNTRYGEVFFGITVMDLPGTIVKYGDTLITFPLILIEVLDG
jgi:hypothetical protein